MKTYLKTGLHWNNYFCCQSNCEKCRAHVPHWGLITIIPFWSVILLAAGLLFYSIYLING